MEYPTAPHEGHGGAGAVPTAAGTRTGVRSACRRFRWTTHMGAPWGPGYPIRPATPGCAPRGGIFAGRASRDRSSDRLEVSSAGPPKLPRGASPEREEEKRSQLREWRSVAATAGSAEQSARAASREREDMTERGIWEREAGGSRRRTLHDDSVRFDESVCRLFTAAVLPPVSEEDTVARWRPSCKQPHV